MSPVVAVDSMPSRKFNASVLSSISRKCGRVELSRDIVTGIKWMRGAGDAPLWSTQSIDNFYM